ncbi:MAG TPA: hypothetical protein VGV13_05740 [Methylomirabilota bacterium]|jgi:hypothetical protein|nr:hypothetical protein [Methylomirabilota bacterium]
MIKTASAWVLTVALAVGVSGGQPAEAADPKVGAWTFGAGLGFLGDTPDGTAFALNGYAEGFIDRKFSVGPLLQLAATGDLAQIGLSGQAKYWIDIPGTENRLKVIVQGGIGFVHAAFRDDDTSWLIPIGAGADYKLADGLNITGTFLLDFTDLDTGRRGRAHVMPGFTVGVRF